jgi:hydrogenase maturation protein HypF
MIARRRLLVSGTVQGVGFRPAVARAAGLAGFTGWVANTPGGAEIEVQGDEGALGDFIHGFASLLPPRASVETLSVEELVPRAEEGFSIRSSGAVGIGGSRAQGASRFSVPPDLAICPACRAEFEDPKNRRYRHPFISCGDCGPRYSYIVELPYDRAGTTMAEFPMCPACRAEYENPRDRRFHIEGFCCPDCGPVLKGFEEGLSTLRGGGIVAVKGIGGYHLACLADKPEAVAELRRRKDRPSKPLAVMYPSLEALEAAASLLPEEVAILCSEEAPILLLPKDRFKSRPLESLAPDNPALGVFLPYAPLQILLLGELGRPLVMTSANMPGDPLIIDDAAARKGLRGVVDGLIHHDRRIISRADDGVVLFQGPGTTRIRNGRGSVPRPFRLASPTPKGVLAVGGELKSTVCVASGLDLVASPHIGDLENEPTFLSFRSAADSMLAYYSVRPGIVACDLHPDYESTRYAIEYAERLDIPLVRVQHHYAHLLSVLLDLGRIWAPGEGPFLGIILDGTGYGSDGTIWGGEILIGDIGGFERAAHLSHLILPGGEAAIREPSRILAAHGLELPGSRPAAESEAIGKIALKSDLSPRSSSCGRLFDAAAALLGFDRRVSFEGEAAIWLENLASEADVCETKAGEAAVSEAPTFDFPPMDGLALLRALREAASEPKAMNRAGLSRLAHGFHVSLARNIAEEAARIAKGRGLTEAFLSGGVYQNRIFTRAIVTELARRGIAARMGERVSPNDACISVGQAAYAIGAAGSIL